MLFSRYNNFKHIPLKMNNEHGKPLLVTEWTTILRMHTKTEVFSRFIDTFMYPFHILFHYQSPPRILPKFKNKLQLIPN